MREEKTRRKSTVHLIFILAAMVMIVLPVAAAGLPPVITLLGRNPTSLTVGSVGYFDAGAMAADPEDGDLTAIINVSSSVNVTRVGRYRVNYTVTDSGNNTVNASRIVWVVNRLNPATIPKYQTPLVIPPEMPKTSTSPAMDYYAIAVREFSQQILPAGMPKTRVWSYGSVTTPGTFNYPAFTIEATAGRLTKVRWVNGLTDRNGNYLPHLLPIDQTLHWANPGGGLMGRDMKGTDPNPYMGPVPAVIHVHGAHVSQESDGYPEAWYLPAAKNIPAGYATTGTFYDTFRANATFGAEWRPGSSVYSYPNNQRATTLWYHDHSLGMTRTNVYTGPAGFYLLRGGPDDLNLGFNRPGVTPNVGVNPADVITEIPIAIQDRSFNKDGSLFYPDSRTFFDGFTGPYSPVSDIAPIWNPEFFGDTIVVNGKTWPYQTVEQRQYRLRLLNGDQARFLILQMDNGMPFTVIGTEGGFLPQPVQQTRLLIGPAERFDVIVDFSAVPAGTNITMQNIGPDEPFGGGVPCPIGQDPVTNPGCGNFAPANAATTGQVMQFRVVSATAPDPSTPVASLVLPEMATLGNASVVRQVSLNEVDSAVLTDPLGNPIGPQEALLGIVMPNATPGGMPMGMPMMWTDAITESVSQGDTETWEIYDFTMDAHPIHIHQVQFQVVNREIFDPMAGTPGTIIPPETWESGYKDTVIVYPGQLTRVKARFDLAGLYVWHCHILEHEDNEMMRPYEVLPAPPLHLTEPNGGNIWTRGSAYPINWTYSVIPGPFVKIELLNGTTVSRVITAGTPIGPAGSGSYLWTIPYNQVPGSTYRIRITSTTAPSYTDTSNANFTIAPGAPLTVTVPDGGQNWTQASVQTIRWKYTGNPGFVRIELLNGTTVSRVIAANTSVGSGGSGSYNWTVPFNQVTGTNYRIRISYAVNPARRDMSNASFTISAGAPLDVRNPDGGQNWTRGTNRTILWAYTGNPGTTVSIHLLKGGVLNTVISPAAPIGSGGRGSFAWTVPPGQVPGVDYRIRITSTANALFTDTSSANFRIS